jgi:hypothetical protein
VKKPVFVDADALQMEGGEEGGEGQQPGGAMGFAAGLMMKARSPTI